MKRFPRLAFTLVELLVVMSIIMILIGIAIPVITSASRTAQRTECVSNLRQCGIAVMLYADHNTENPRMYYPYGYNAGKGWSEAVAEFMRGKSTNNVFTCPGSTYDTDKLTYSAHAALMPTSSSAKRFSLADVHRPSEIVLATDATQQSGSDHASDWTLSGLMSNGSGFISASSNRADQAVSTANDKDPNKGYVRYRHRVGIRPAANVVCADGHAEAFAKGDLKYRNFDINY